MRLLLFKDYLNKWLLKLFFSFLVINLIISCRTKRASSSLSAVSDSDFKLSLVKKSVSLDSDSSDLPAYEFYDFSLCPKKYVGECVNVFATDDGAKISFNIEGLDDLDTSLALSVEEIDELKNKVEKTGLVNQLTQKGSWDNSALEVISTGSGGFLTMLAITELQLYNKDQARARKLIASTVADLNSKVMELRTRLGSSNQSSIGIYRALNQNYLHSKKISDLFLKREAQLASIAKGLAGKDPMSIRGPKTVAFYTKKAQEIDKEFIDNLETFVKKARYILSSIKEVNINKQLIDAPTINDYLKKRSDDLSKFLKETKEVIAYADASTVYKRTQFDVLADFYVKIGERNKKLFDSKDIIVSIDEAAAVEASDSLIKSARSAKLTLLRQTAVLEKLYSKPLFAGSKIDFLGRSIARSSVEAAGWINRVDMNLKGEKLIRANRRLNKPILMVADKVFDTSSIATFVVIGVIVSAFRHKSFSKQDSSKAETGESDVKAIVEMASPEQSQELASKSQFYQSVHAAFSMDESVDQSVDSVRDFVKKLALYLNTNLLEGDLKITKLCFPNFNKKEYCKSI